MIRLTYHYRIYKAQTYSPSAIAEISIESETWQVSSKPGKAIAIARELPNSVRSQAQGHNVAPKCLKTILTNRKLKQVILWQCKNGKYSFWKQTQPIAQMFKEKV
jgi:hypothetical protein